MDLRQEKKLSGLKIVTVNMNNFSATEPQNHLVVVFQKAPLPWMEYELW